MPLLFSYGTLQQEDVQLSTFGRSLDGERDELPNVEPSLVRIEDPQFVTASGKTHHANVTFSASAKGRVSGMVFEVSDAELANVDEYESRFQYRRVAALLASGRQSWVYVHAPAVESDLAQLIRSADENDVAAADRLFTMLYQELHNLAEHHIGRAGGLTVGTTTLVHEAYLRVADREGVSFPDRSRFLAYASRAMRGLVIDYARRRRAQKRGRQFEITLHGDELEGPALAIPSEEWDQLEGALSDLAALDPRLAELVDLHFFCGFSFAEIAEQRGVSERTVQRDWRKARLLLHHAILQTEE